VRVVAAAEPEMGITGKNNALITAVRDAHAPWLLFTDADTWHYPGSLAATVAEAEARGLDLLSYSPEQETGTWSERILMPVVFADLARAYDFARVNDPRDQAAAANGQYILARRSVYEALGGHRRVAGAILEDVELARLFKNAGRAIWFGSGTGMVKTRMYRGFRSLCEGWTKNLALLFSHPVRLAAWRLLEFMLIAGGLLGAGLLPSASHLAWRWVALIVGLGCLAVFLRRVFPLRIRTAGFSWMASVASVWGLPFFAGLLVRSWWHSRVRGTVTWKGRSYSRPAPPNPAPVSSLSSSSPTLSLSAQPAMDTPQRTMPPHERQSTAKGSF